MKIIKIKELELIPNPHGVEVKKAYENSTSQVMQLTMKPDQEMDMHQHDVDVFFYVISGEGMYELGNEKNNIGEDTIVEAPAGIPRRWKNISDKDLRLLVVKSK